MGGEPSANLVEIFSSAQGEGPHVGASTLFVRFGECDLRCAWCDSPETWKPAAQCRVERRRGSGAFATRANPVGLADLLALLEDLDVFQHRFVSLTGGEPLLQVEAVEACARALYESEVLVHLETHGLTTEAMKRVAPWIDVVSMDWKLATDVRRAGESSRAPRVDFHDEHQRFLATAMAAREVYVKVVVTPETLDEELDEVCRCIVSVERNTLLVLQPVTPCGSVKETPSAERLLRWLRRCEATLPRVRLIPQTHKQISVL